MNAQGRQILGEAGCGARVLPLQAGDQEPQPVFGVGGIDSFIQRLPVGMLDALVQLRAVGQLGDEVAQAVHRPNAIRQLRFTLTIPFMATFRPYIRRRRSDAKFP